MKQKEPEETESASEFKSIQNCLIITVAKSSNKKET